jgi:aminoglycoside phosphotransferase family enzyme
MTEAAFYPHSCPSVEPVQTLTAWLLFAGDLVYKVKKPVHFSFIDARTPARRYRLCHNEVVLNRRLAPETYLGVAGITVQARNYTIVPNATPNLPGVCEFAVVMHRLPSERMLSQMIAGKVIGPAEIKQVAERLTEFHLECSMAKSKVWGSAAALSRLMAATVAEAEALMADTVMRHRLAAAARYLRAFVINHQRLLDQRARSGRIRHGHGEVRADSVFLVSQAAAIIGRIEHSERLRYCDVASELASVTLDLAMGGRNDLASALEQAYVATSKDAEIPELMGFYTCYRAVRRGQLEMLTSVQTDMPRERRMLARHRASRWFECAEHIAAASPARAASY